VAGGSAEYTAHMQTRETEFGTLVAPTPIEARGDGDGLPAVVIIHDVWGLSDHFRDLARRFADEGFAALALNLYRAKSEVQISDPGAWMRELSDPEMLEGVADGVSQLAAMPGVNVNRISVVGFCMGGMYALMAAAEVPGLAASVPFYGLLSHDHGLLHSEQGLDPVAKPQSPLACAQKVRCPLLAFFGGSDPYVPSVDVESLRGIVTGLATPAELVVYPDAGHAFMNDTRPEMYDADAAVDAWQRMLTFLRSTGVTKDARVR
jgi:carboxymethylenebutenolidase